MVAILDEFSIMGTFLCPTTAAPNLNESVLSLLIEESKVSNGCAQFAKAFKPNVCQVPEILTYAMTNVQIKIIDNVIDSYGLTQDDADAILGKFEKINQRAGSAEKFLDIFSNL